MSSDEHRDFHKEVVKRCRENSNSKGLEFANTTSDIVVVEIGDGNLNDVLRVTALNVTGNNSAMAKRGPPYIKCLGPEYPLTIDRTKVEYSALVKFDSIVPGCVPKPLCWVQESNMFFMEDLNGFEVLRKLLIKGSDCEKAILTLAKNIAIVHRETYVSTLSEKDITVLCKEYRNDDMVSLTKKFVFTAPFVKEDPTNKCADNVKPILSQIYEDSKVVNAAEKMRNIFMERKECLVHGDLHTGSVMCTTDGENPKMIDLEFAYVGPCAFDVGMFIANLIFTYYQHMSIPQDNDIHRQYCYHIIELAKQFVEVYLQHNICAIDQSTFISDVTGFCGCEIIRRLIGAAHVEDFNETEYAEQDALGAGIRLLRAVDRINSIDNLMVIALMLA